MRRRTLVRNKFTMPSCYFTEPIHETLLRD